MNANIASKSKRSFALIVLALVLAVLLTRGLTLLHERTLHADEPVFFNSSASMANKLMDPSSTYKVAKTYPEGAFVMQAPFQILGRIYCQLTGAEEDAQLWARIASLCYYTLGCIMGAWILYRYMGGQEKALIFYACIMVFSLFQIEQSRYGTGEAPSFFLLMAGLWMTALYLQNGKWWSICAAGLTIGALGAVKYPQLFFALYPACGIAMGGVKMEAKGRARLRKALHGVLLLLTLLVGFFVLSPTALREPQFIPQVIANETGAYLTYGNSMEVGSPLEHLLSLLVYQLFYADFPLALPIVIYAVVRLVKGCKEDKSSLRRFFAIAVPAGMAVFYVYNLFVTTVFFRTYYPYFCLCELYTAYGLEWLFEKKKVRAVVAALCAVMLLRGGFMTAVFSETDRSEALDQLLTQNPHWEERTGTVLMWDEFRTGSYTVEEPTREARYYELFQGDYPELQPGEFLITVPLEHGFGVPYLLPITNEYARNTITGWQRFKEEHSAYYIGQPYPEWYYYLFGFYIHGSTGTPTELPTNYVYYRGLE